MGVFSTLGENRLLPCVEKQVILLPPELIIYIKQAVSTKITPRLFVPMAKKLHCLKMFHVRDARWFLKRCPDHSALKVCGSGVSVTQERTTSVNRSGASKFQMWPTPGTITPLASWMVVLISRAACCTTKVSFCPTVINIGTCA